MRVLRLDSFRAARVGLLLAAANMALLVLWFFLARVTLYEVSGSIKPSADGRVAAAFSQDALARIHIGQRGWLRLDPGTDQPAVRIPVLVYDVPPQSADVELVILDPEYTVDSSAQKVKGQVEIEVEYVSPVELVMRTTGKMLNRNQVPISPQQPEQPQE